MSSRDPDQEVLQIHLVPKALGERVALRAAAQAKLAADGKPDAPLPPFAPNFEHFSGRGVRYRVLSPEEKDALLNAAAIMVGPGGYQIELDVRHGLECVKRMLVAVTRRAELTTLDGLGTGDWVPLNDSMLAGMPGQEQWRFEKLFTAKDVGVLRAIYRRLHVVSEADVDEIEGKATPMILE